jgi:hypothetical protein
MVRVPVQYFLIDKHLYKNPKNAPAPSVADRGCYPGSEFFHPGSRIQSQKNSGSRIRTHIKKFKNFYPKKLFLRYWKYDQGCSSGSKS